MSASLHHLFLLLSLAFLSSLFCCESFAVPLTCPRSNFPEVADELRSPQCPLRIERYFPEEVIGDVLNKELSQVQDGAYYFIFFYASWCPFSQSFKSTFDTLSSMFPQIRHLAVEQSSAMPSVFSRYGIHSFPAFLLASRTARIRYQGSKDLDSLVDFYREITGEEPVAYLSVDQADVSTAPLQPWRGTTKEFLKNEPYLALSLLFIFLRGIGYSLPIIVSLLKASWALCARFCTNDLGIFSGLNQLLGRALLVVNAMRMWSKFGLFSKTRNFHRGAQKSARRVWASSLASVSLGESSSSRSALSNS